ncbi:MAG TPA: hypothetical protein PKN95_03510 [Verrucomicrobiota bacterium]|nr:hypothetical protein [Verrucomicrobiota bacterium]HNT14397.1 hypothetical protein [Verrucomicrobiota bacterium]
MNLPEGGLLWWWRARTLIRIRNGTLHAAGETLQPHVMRAVAEVVQTAGITRGRIILHRDGRVRFSRHVPAVWHQRLRNVLLNP